MIKKNNNISTKIKYVKNPFIVELKGKMFLQPRANTIIAKGENIIDTSTGEVIQEQVLIGRRKVVDKSQFAKIYASEIGFLYELNRPAINVFLYLLKVMDYENKAFFNWKEIYNTYASAYRGIKQLIINNIIAPTAIQNVYWINPTVACKGERFAKYTEYVIGEDNPNEKPGDAITISNQKLKEGQDPKTQEKYEKTAKITSINSDNQKLFDN